MKEYHRPRILVLRQTQPHDQLRRELVIIDAPPVAVIDGAQLIMARWWHRAGGYPVGRVFGTFMQT